MQFARRPGRLFWILGGAFAARAIAALAVQKVLRPGQICLIAGDAEGYWELARKLSQGQDFAIYDPPRYVERMPGLPALLAFGMLLFGENLLAERLLLAVVGTIACGLVFALGRTLFDVPTGLIAAALAAVSPPLVGFNALLLSETLFAMCLTASLIPLAWLMQHWRADASPAASRFGVALSAGLLIGLATLVRPTWILVGPGFWFLGVVLSRHRVLAAVQGLVLMAGLAAALAPWTVRNFWVTGHFVPTSLWMGPSLYDGLNPKADGSSHMEFVERDGVYKAMSEYDADRHYRAAAVDFARNNPGRAVWLSAVKLWRFWKPWPSADQFGHPLAAAVLTLTWVLTMLPAALGVWLSRDRLAAWSVPLAPIVYFSLVHLVFVGSLRYRLPAEYPLCVLSAVGWRALWLWQQERHRWGAA